MDVRPVGAGPLSGADLTPAAGPVASVSSAGTSAGGGAVSAAPLDSAAVAELSPSDLASLVRLFETLPADAARATDLIRTAVVAAAEGDTGRVLGALTEAVRLNPAQMETLHSEPGLDPVRAAVEPFLNRLAAVARLDAESRVSHAAELLGTRGELRLPGWDASPEVLLVLAHRLLDAGGHANYVRSADLAQVVIDASARALPALAQTPVADVPAVRAERTGERPYRLRGGGWRERALPRLRNLWRRAPLLILLLAWLGMGLVFGTFTMVARALSGSASLGDAGFEVWALGFLVLVLFGFYARVRNLFRP